MNNKFKIIINILKIAFFISLVYIFSMENIETYEYYNDVAIEKVNKIISHNDIILLREVENTQRLLESTYIRVIPELEQSIVFNKLNFNTNPIIYKIPKQLVGNIFGLGNEESYYKMKKEIGLSTYVQKYFNNMQYLFNRDNKNVLTRTTINSISMFIEDKYIYTYPYEYFEEDDNKYQEKINQYTEEYIEGVYSENKLHIKELHKNSDGEYIFSLLRPIYYFENPIGFISIDFNYFASGIFKKDMLTSYVYNEDNKLVTTDSENLTELHLQNEVEYYLKSDELDKTSILLKYNEESTYYKDKKIYFINYLDDYDLTVVNVIEAKNIFGVFLEILILSALIAFLTGKVITSFFNNKNLKTEINKAMIEIEKQNIKIEESIKNDLSTNTLSKYEMERVLDREILDYNTSNPFTLAICDIDDIKNINEKYGYFGGDEVLKQVINIINENLKVNDTVSKWNGHQILILLRDTKQEEGFMVIEDIRQKISQTPFILYSEEEIVTVSFGVIEHTEKMIKNKTIKALDDSLYKAKQNGKNQTVLFK